MLGAYGWWQWLRGGERHTGLYTVEALDLTAVVHVAMLGMSVTGLASWRRELASGAVTGAAGRAAA